MFVECKYSNNFSGSFCRIENERIPTEVIEGTFVKKNYPNYIAETNHEPISTNTLQILNSNFVSFQIPRGFCENFFNVTKLTIENTNLMDISKENLKFPKLWSLHLNVNRIEFLPGDLFKYNYKLKYLSVSNNKIKFIGPELLDGLENLQEADFEKNPAINYKATKDNLDELKRLIKENCKPPNATNVASSSAFGVVKKTNASAIHELTSTTSQTNNRELIAPQQNFLSDLNVHLALDEFKDFVIKIGEKEFKVHKLLFAARSQTFADLIRNNPEVTELVLTDISVETFESILRFVYTDEPPKDLKNAREIFAAASKLKIQKLKEITEKIIENEINNENLTSLMESLNLGIKLKSENLKLNAFEEIKKHFPGKKLKEELSDEPEKLKKIIEAKKLMDEFME